MTLYRAAWFALLLMISFGAKVPGGQPALEVDFRSETPGEEPSNASVSSGPDRRVLVAGADSVPSDPFGGEGNRSLRMDNLVRNRSSNVSFPVAQPVVRGAFATELFLVHAEEDEQGRSLRSARFQIFLSGPEGRLFLLNLGGGRALSVQTQERSISMDQAVPANRPVFLRLSFDAEEGHFEGTLNGVPLTAGRGAESRFAMPPAPQGVTAVSMRPGSSSVSASRVFVNSVSLGPPGTVEPPPTEGVNLLTNPAFEHGDEPREVYPIIGEYRHRGAWEWGFDENEKVHGTRSLRMEGTRPFVWEVLHRDTHAHVFSVHLKSEAPGAEVEIGVEKIAFNNEGGAWSEGKQVKTVSVGTDWQRHAVSASWEPGERRVRFISSHLYRAWVRPTEAGKVWVDAAQLERDREEPGDFSSERGANALTSGLLRIRNTRFIGEEPEDWSTAGRGSGSGEIALTVRETAGLPRRSEPVRGGVPFPRGELHDPAAVRLVDAEGSEVHVQTRALAWWPQGGGVRSLLVDFQTDAGPNENRRFALQYGRRPQSPPQGRLAREEDGRIVLDTGVLRAVVNKGRFNFFERLESAGGVVLGPAAGGGGSFAVGLDGRLFSSAWGPPNEVRIEENGPLRAVVYVQGEHFSEDGEETLLDYEVRIHAFAGRDHLLIEHAFENRDPKWNNAIQSQYLRLPTMWEGGAGEARFDLVAPDGRVGETRAALPRDGVFALTQVSDYFGEGQYAALVENGHEGAPAETLEGARLAGWLDAGGSLLAVEDFWQMHPKRIAARPGAINLYHWPGRHVTFADVPFGMSNSLRAVYAPFGGQAAAGAPQAAGGVQAPFPVVSQGGGGTLGPGSLLLQTDAKWTAASEVFGRFLTAEETAVRFPRYERVMREFFDLMAVERTALDLTGMWDYGDMGSPGRWANNEHTITRNLWLEYLRTGDPALYERARIMTRHMRDVDVLYGGLGSRHQHHHAGGIHTMQSYHMGHYWVTGLVWHYLLTGDMRTFDVARDMGAGLMTKYGNNYTGRNRARLLFHAAELYELTGQPEFRRAFEVQYGHGQPTDMSDYHAGKGVLALLKWYDITGDSEFFERAERDADEFLRRRDGASPSPTTSGRGWTVFEMLGEVARRTGERRFVEQYYDNFLWHVLGQDTSEHNMVRGAGFLEAADRFGIGEHPAMPEHLFDFRLMTGQTNHYLLRFGNVGRGRVIPFDVYRMLGGSVEVQVERPGGDAVSEFTLEEMERPDWRRGSIAPRDARGGEAFVRLQGRGGSRFAFSTAHEPVFLDAAQSFTTRRGRAGTSLYRFALRAPREQGHLDVRYLRWPRAAQLPGRAVAVWLQDEEGKVVSSARWVTPLTAARFPLGDAADTLPEGARLHVPPEYRGRPLWLTVFAPLGRYFRWQVEGLEEPWLGRTLSDFEAPR